MTQRYDMVIVGAGMVGAALACALADRGLRLAVLDAQPLDKPAGRHTASGYDPRVSALSAASEAILRNVGAWQRLDPAAPCGYRHMRVWDAEGTGSISFDAEALGEPRLGHIVENYRVQQALLDRLVETPVNLFAGRRLEGLVREPDSWRLVMADGERFEAPLVVAGDGARSHVRELAGFPMREWDYLHHAIVTTVETAKPHRHTAWQRFLPSGPLAFLPLPDREGRHYCSIVWSAVPDFAAELMALDDQTFCQRLAGAFEYRLGEVLAADPRHNIPLRQRHARSYAMEGLVLIGDAAHSIHPLAGQGVNLGLLDVAELVSVLDGAMQRGERLAGLNVLQRYERGRMGANLGMMLAMEGFQRLFHADSLTLRWLRNTGMRLLEGQGVVKNGIIRQAMGLSPSLPTLARHPDIVRQAS
ncbi:FAD-dependent monooxygenase [Pseudomonas sp.]|uniref:FAD-dependent monooxygenase n=1 Tax=Pseudomonas sp. TaxID=306 RepID=UPI00272AD00B|nr:FAD-dependent monooxygenase [Pseudomonas sp.]